MASLQFRGNSILHLLHRFGGLTTLQTAVDILERASAERLLWPQQDAVSDWLDGKLRAWRPLVGVSDGFGQNHLALR
jgi:hypothetical protein